MAAGLAGNAVMTLLLALIDYDTSNWLIAANMFVRGLFMAFIFVPMQAVSFATISPESMGRASSILSVTRQVAASLGVAIMATALTSRLAHHDAVLGLHGDARRGAARVPGHVHLRRPAGHPRHPRRAVD